MSTGGTTLRSHQGHGPARPLPSIEAPPLVVSAAEDPATPPDHGRLIRDAIPGARFEVIPDAAHIANVERSETITHLILDHLEARCSLTRPTTTA